MCFGFRKTSLTIAYILLTVMNCCIDICKTFLYWSTFCLRRVEPMLCFDFVQ